jgi:hypothetical protein
LGWLIVVLAVADSAALLTANAQGLPARGSKMQGDRQSKMQGDRQKEKMQVNGQKETA